MKSEVRSQRSEVRSQRTEDRNQKSGFSLVELLVTMGVLSTLVVLLMSFFTQATDAWSKSENRVDSFREVRAAFYYIKRDLGTMIVSDQLPWVHLADPYTGTDDLMEAAISGNRSKEAQGNAIFFLSAKTSSAQGGQGSSDLCAVGYYLAWGPDWNSAQSPDYAPTSSYKLYRYFKASDTLWNNGFQAFLQDWDPPSRTSTSHLFPTPLALVGASGDEVIARNVVNFKLTPYRWNTTTATYEAPPSGVDWGAWQTDGKFVRPDMIEVSLLAFNAETAQRLGDQNQWHFTNADLMNPNSGIPQPVRESAEVFHMRVPLK